MHLGLDHHRPSDLLGDGGGLVRCGCDLAGQDGDPESGKDFLGLIFVDVHCAVPRSGLRAQTVFCEEFVQHVRELRLTDFLEFVADANGWLVDFQ